MSFAGGVLWGVHVAHTGQEATPRTAWVSLGLAGVCGVAAAFAPPRAPEKPWRWDASRWITFALSSLAVGVGAIVGFETAA